MLVRLSVRTKMLAILAVAAAIASAAAVLAYTAGRSSGGAVSITVIIGGAIGVLAAVALPVAHGLEATCRGLSAEISRLAHALRHGDLGARLDESKGPPEFRAMFLELNAGIEAVARPVLETQARLERLSHGDIPEHLDAAYEGAFAQIADSTNRCLGAVEATLADIATVASTAFTGNLSVRADPLKHEGDFRVIVEGVNATLDSVLTPVNEAIVVLERLARRDLRARVEGDYAGDHSRLKDAVNTTAQQLHGALMQVATSVRQVAAAAGEIASSSQAVASGASEQASALEETGSSLESMSDMTKQAAGNAQQASTLATTARAAATQGSAALAQMTTAMGKIKSSAEGTSQIIKDINEIAFQTNLLALNAAVEAARAGEAGRGFAVVAEEVRSLAQRSKEAANKTEELIRQSVKEAAEGEITAGKVNGQFSEILASVSKVSDIVAEIAAASREQAGGIDQVNKAMCQMNTITQQNAASSEETSSSAMELSGQSDEMAAVVASFQLEDPSGAAPSEGVRKDHDTQVKAAIAAHGMWKTHLVAAITTGTATIKVEDCGHDDRCSFGKWLHGTPELKSSAGYGNIVDLHARFHQEASGILQLALSGKKVEARRLMDSTSIYTRTSTDLFRVLQSWVVRSPSPGAPAVDPGVPDTRRRSRAVPAVTVTAG